jgi:hypothetical protein
MDSTDSQESGEDQKQQLYASCDFEVTYVPLRMGFYPVGGLRVLYLGEGDDGVATEGEASGSMGLELQIGRKVQDERRRAQILKEYDVVAEIMVSS